MTDATVSAPPSAQPKPIMWSASSWATWKQCPFRQKLREQKWANPGHKADSRMAVMAVPGLVIDKLFELWFYRREFENHGWLKDNFDLVWKMICEKKHPKFSTDHERACVRRQTIHSVGVLYRLLYQHELLNDQFGVQTEFHEPIADGISIAGAIDLWTVRRDGTLVVVDFKNFASHGHRSVDQLHLYALALEKLLHRAPMEAGYVAFHPEYAGYRKTALRQCDKNKLLSRLVKATEMRRRGEFPAKYSFVTCPRFCEQRFQCPEFLKRAKWSRTGAVHGRESEKSSEF